MAVQAQITAIKARWERLAKIMTGNITRHALDGKLNVEGHYYDHQSKKALSYKAYANKLAVRKENMPAWLRDLIQ